MFLGIISFFIFGALNFLLLKAKMTAKTSGLEAGVEMKKSLFYKVLQEKLKVEEAVVSLNQTLTKTLNMYEAARDICVSLEEEQLVLKFKEDLKNLIDFKECLIFNADSFDSKVYASDLIFPLVAQEQCLGYLVIKGLARADYPYLGILANHLALGLKRARLYKKIQDLAIMDSLTSIYTRRYAMERLEEEYARSKTYQLNLSFFMIDVDYFKVCNDKFGHLVGDNVLVELAHRIKENIREIDMLARFGGEEFMVFAPNTSKESALVVAERIRSAIASASIRAYDEKVETTVSIGVATFPIDAPDVNGLIEAADMALYKAKELGRNKVCC